MGDDGNRQVELKLGQVAIGIGLDPAQFESLDLKLGAIHGAVDKLAENVSSEPDTSVANEIMLLKQEVVVGFSGLQQSLANLNNVIFDRSVDLAKWLAAIALATSTPDDNSAEVQKRIDELTATLKPEADALEQSATKEGE